jgi:hypothetical protein
MTHERFDGMAEGLAALPSLQVLALYSTWIDNKERFRKMNGKIAQVKLISRVGEWSIIVFKSLEEAFRQETAYLTESTANDRFKWQKNEKKK